MKKSDIMLIVSLVTSAGALVTSAIGCFKMKKVADKVGITIDNMADNIDVDIPESVISAATDKAVEKAAEKAAREVTSSIKREFDRDIRSEVRKAVNSEKESIKSEVKEQIKKEVGYIDISNVKEEVINEAKSESMERFKADLDAVVSAHNQKLKDTQEIYSSIAKTMKSAAS